MSNPCIIGLLHLNKEAVIGIDGQTISLKTDDFVGFTANFDQDAFHLVSIRAQPQAHLSVGFLVTSSSQSLFRQYDPQTEEMSSQPLDDLSQQNLMQQIQSNQMAPSRLLPYHAIVPSTQAKQWSSQTHWIQKSGILTMRNLVHGDKIVPGSLEESQSSSAIAPPSSVDGKSVPYPPIPVVDVSVSRFSKRHLGTKQYLSSLAPSKRTKLFVCDDLAATLLGDLLSQYYQNQWQAVLGDLQLAYTLFLHLQCLASLEHWKDLVAMLCRVGAKGMAQHVPLYKGFLQLLPSQLMTMDKGFLEDVDEAGDNFLIPSLQTFCQNLSKLSNKHVGFSEEDVASLQHTLTRCFPSMMIVVRESNDDDDDDDDQNDVEDDDGPVMVSSIDVQAAWDRAPPVPTTSTGVHDALPASVLQTFPILVAAILPHEDILMTCARALDEKKDVSLVRQAACYLEEIEKYK
eukprot:Nitzschia sp. Nitz4//scaffold388_size11999//10383//11945//NITZ4_009006-RA/size11999-augustus-gene-0.2-mRNA-1//-1//CDS//3329549986//4282//frame0